MFLYTKSKHINQIGQKSDCSHFAQLCEALHFISHCTALTEVLRIVLYLLISDWVTKRLVGCLGTIFRSACCLSGVQPVFSLLFKMSMTSVRTKTLLVTKND